MIALAHCYPEEINGVPLYTQAGTPRRRFSEEERVQMLGDAPDNFEYFVSLFNPRRAKYIIRRTTTGEVGNWRTVHHTLSATDITYHLLGDRLPGREPLWVGSFGGYYTRWAAIDVDYHGDPQEFQNRCDHILQQLRVLDIPKKSLLILPSPSGGKHIYFFFRQSEYIGLVYEMLNYVGLEHRPGIHEIYPRRDHGFRLPFGHVDHAPAEPDAWLDFIRRYRDKTFPRVNAKRCWNRAVSYAKRNQFPPFECDQHTWQSNPLTTDTRHAAEKRQNHQPIPTAKFGIPKAQRQRGGDEPGQCNYENRKIRSVREAEQLIREGIPRKGTRVEYTIKAAWHQIHFQHLTRSEAAAWCVDWVYRTGRHTSVDVQTDLARGTRQVEKHTKKIVGWVFDRFEESGGRRSTKRREAGFAIEEIEALADHLKSLQPGDQFDRGTFVLELLRFNKTYGRLTPVGWECPVDVRGVIRKWQGCSGMRYKPKLDAVLGIGLVEMTREKRQRGNRHGRPRTYAVRLPLVKRHRWNLDFDQARNYLQAVLDKKSTSGAHSVVVTKVTRMSLSPEGSELPSWKGTQAIVNQSRCDEGVVQTSGSSETSNQDTSDHRSPHHASKPEQHMAVIAGPPSETITSPNFEQSGGTYEQPELEESRNSTPLGVGPKQPRSTPGRNHSGDHRRPGRVHSMPTSARPGRAGSSHPGRAGGSLASREKELLAQQEVIPVLRDPTPGQQPTAGTIHRARQYLDAEAAALRAGAEGPTPDELNAAPVDHIDAIKLILDVRRQQARNLTLSRSTQLHVKLLAAQKVFENTKLELSDAWLLLACPDRLTLADHYRRDKLINTHGTPKDSPESVTVALSTT